MLVFNQALQQDVLSYQRVIESITDKVSNLVQSNRDSELSKFISQARSWHSNLCATAKVSGAKNSARNTAIKIILKVSRDYTEKTGM